MLFVPASLKQVIFYLQLFKLWMQRIFNHTGSRK
jgi:hypothetical protein